MAGPAVRALLLAALLSAGGGGGSGGGGSGGGWSGGGGGGGYAAYAQQVAPCTFNSMCTCKLGGPGPPIHLTTPRSMALVKDISCIGVPFAKMPELSGGAQVAHMDVVSSGLEALEGEALGAAQVESLRLMSNRIQLVGERAFAVWRGPESYLTNHQGILQEKEETHLKTIMKSFLDLVFLLDDCT